MPSNLISQIGLDLGLDKFHSELYCELLELEEPTIADLSRNLGVYRLKIYQGLEHLEKEDFLEMVKTSLNEDKISQIRLKSPGAIMAKLRHKKLEMERRTRDFEELMPELLGKYYQKNREPEVKIYTGKNQFYQLFNETLIELNDEILILGEHEDFYNIVDFDYYYQNWCIPRAKKKIPVKVLVYKHQQLAELDKISAKEYREIKWLPENLKVPGSMWVYGAKVIFWNSTLPKAIYIDDILVANFCRSMFVNIWETR